MVLGWAWAIWILAFVGIEGYALYNRTQVAEYGTLSKWIRWALGFTGPVKWLRWLFYIFVAWFTAHIAGWI